MLDDLIKEGTALEDEIQESMWIKCFKSVNFETWAAKSMLYLERNHPDSVLTEKLKDHFKELNSNNNHSFYLSLLGALKATKDFEEADQASVHVN